MKSRGVAPDRVASFELRVRELTCRGRANLLVGLLERDDLYQIPGSVPNSPGYYKLEAWPDPITAVVRISYDPACADENSFKQAITEPYYDMAADRWWQSPFVVRGLCSAWPRQRDCGSPIGVSLIAGDVSQKVAPNKAPTPAVSAIARAPQNVTRAAARNTGEPPARAAKEPNSARKHNELPETIQTSAEVGTKTTIRSGMAAPTANVAAEASAACTGRALRVSEMPNSSRA